MRNRPVLTGNVPPLMHAFDSNASTHNIKTERVLRSYFKIHANRLLKDADLDQGFKTASERCLSRRDRAFRRPWPAPFKAWR
jgi:hypothetical protein